ncbi:hypothetical protein Celaphus_00018675 [Cervus elaphus hippelaphus]|uniref:Uncharacterized protein n=1 Tax=Cervus elaphus hippelaphus TaxID=46360 RepID=A0A212CM65_CEREH|nr:hypothetical protein Celaphus_00018675 [Cervus elaphus hippelaphus]
MTQSHSNFEQGTAKMMKLKGSWDMAVDVLGMGPSDNKKNKKVARKISGLPKDGSASGLLRKLSLMQEEELLSLQLPDWLPSQLPLQDFKTKVANRDGQMVVIKQDKAGSQGARERLYPG